MVRTLFPGHRRYSITHRAVQRLRELVPSLGDLDDEHVRDRLDGAIGQAEDADRAVRTLDVMLGEPQILVPLDAFGEILYAIIKEETVVTVLPRGHGEEILQRGQALEQRVAAGEIPPPQPEETERWESPRRRWRREVAPPLVERIARSNGTPPPLTHEAANESPVPPPLNPATEALLTQAVEQATQRVRGRIRLVDNGNGGHHGHGDPPRRDLLRRDDSPVTAALARGLERAQREAAVTALSEIFAAIEPERPLLPLWNQLLEEGLPPGLTVEDLVSAIRQLPPA